MKRKSTRSTRSKKKKSKADSALLPSFMTGLMKDIQNIPIPAGTPQLTDTTFTSTLQRISRNYSWTFLDAELTFATNRGNSNPFFITTITIHNTGYTSAANPVMLFSNDDGSGSGAVYYSFYPSGATNMTIDLSKNPIRLTHKYLCIACPNVGANALSVTVFGYEEQ
jgi:hypothetical protein